MCYNLFNLVCFYLVCHRISNYDHFLFLNLTLFDLDFLFFNLFHILNKKNNNNINNNNDDDDNDNNNKYFVLIKFQILHIYLLTSLYVLVHKPSSLKFESFEADENLIFLKKNKVL